MRTRSWSIFLWIISFWVLEALCVGEGEEDGKRRDGYLSLPAPHDGGESLNLFPVERQDIGFNRERRKYSRRLWYITCTRRRRCHCYSRRMRQYFCCDCDSGPCFPGDSEVITRPSGKRTAMHRLRLGQFVLAVDKNGDLVDSKVLGFLDKRPNETAPYITFGMESGLSVSLSATHLIYGSPCDNTSIDEKNEMAVHLPSQPLYAEQIQPGYILYTLDGDILKKDPVINVSYSLKTGAYVPLTEHGTIIVDGAVASCYASFPHWLAHASLAPVRLFPELLDSEESQHIHGLRKLPAILKTFGHALSKIMDIKSYNSDDVIKFYSYDEHLMSPNL